MITVKALATGFGALAIGEFQAQAN